MYLHGLYSAQMNSKTNSKRQFLLFALLISGQLLFAQTIFTLSGKVFRRTDSIPLTGASVYLHESGMGAVTGQSGLFQLDLPQGQHRIGISFLGYKQIDILIRVNASYDLDFYLTRGSIRSEGVTITAESGSDYVNSLQMGEISLSNFEISQLPSLLGESDPIRFLQLTPGVQSSSEAGVGFYVRGGGVDQNMVLFDNTLIYNPGHLMGFFSVFNPDIIKEVSLIKSGMPARYGGRLSSVVNANSFKGSSDSLTVKGQIGLISSRIAVNRSLNRNRGSFIISARIAYPDLVVKPAMDPFLKDFSNYFKNSRYQFYDFNAGFSHRIGDRDYLSFSGHYGQDKFRMEREEIKAENALDWGNRVGSLRWNHIFNHELSLSNSLSFTRYDFNLSGSQSEYFFNMFSSVTDYTYKVQLSQFSDNHSFAAGLDLVNHSFTPNEIDVKSGSLVADFVEFNKLYAWEGGIYAEDDIKLSDHWSAGAGLRYSFFNQVGPYTEYLKDESSLITDSILYPPGESLAFYHHLEPRISLKYQIDHHSSLKASFMRVTQYVHLATSASVSLPMDIWFPSSKNIPPQLGDQVSLGYYRKLLNDKLETSVELYYKRTQNQLEFINGIIHNSINMMLEDNIAIGRSTSYGSEFFIRKKAGKTSGWVSYTFSRTERQFDRINEGKIYPAKYDRRHDLSVAFIHRINDLWNASAVFIYVSGAALTIPVGRYMIQGNIVNEYGEVNSFRMPPYHRLDLSLTRKKVTGNGNVSSWNFSVYNVYSRANPFYIYFETVGNLEEYQLEVHPVLVSLFPVIPSVSWSFVFK